MKPPYWICLDDTRQLDELRSIVMSRLLNLDPSNIRYSVVKELSEKLKSF